MKLILDREDLEREYADINCSQTKFKHFRISVQQAIREAGKATFQEYDGSNYNVIYPPTMDEIMRNMKP